MDTRAFDVKTWLGPECRVYARVYMLALRFLGTCVCVSVCMHVLSEYDELGSACECVRSERERERERERVCVCV